MIDLVKVLLVLIFVVLLLRRRLNLGLIMLLASLLLELLFLKPLTEFLAGILTAVVSRKSLEMTAALLLTMIMENILRRTETLRRMVESLFNLLPDPRLVMAGMPAMIGMLPSPGGAVFSAPMVKEAARSLDIPPDQKAFINYWYRHIWEYVSPLYPGIILVSAITTLSFQTLALAHLPFALSVVLWGVPFGFRGISTVPVGSDHRLKSRGRALLTFVLSISPIIGTLLLVVVLRVNVVLSMGGVTLFLYLLHRYSPRAIFESLRESISLKGLFLVIGIMIFKEILEVTGALTSISHLFVASGLPKLLIITTIPFLAGLMTGLTIAFVAITFPILLPLMGGVPPEPWLVAIAFGSGFAGVMLSPVHLCLILTRDYFEADMGRVYRRLFLPSALVFASVVISWLIWS